MGGGGEETKVVSDRLTPLLPAEEALRQREEQLQKTEEQLAESEARLFAAQRIAHVGSWVWEVEPNRVVWSDELYRIYGLERGQFSGTYEAFLGRVHPDDLARTKSTLFDVVRNLRPFVYDHRIVRPNGDVRMLHTQGEVVTDTGGKLVRMLGACSDLTEQWEARREIERSNSLLHAALEATTDGLLIVDRAGKITAYNQRLLDLWRIPAELAARGDDDALLAFVADQLDDPDAFLLAVRELYSRPDASSADVLRLRDDRTFERHSRPQRIGDEIVGRVWSFHDVSDRERLFRRALFLADASRLLASLEVEQALDAVARLAVPYLGDGCAIDILGDGGPRRLLALSRDPAQPMCADLPRAVLAGRPLIYPVGSISYMAVPLTGRSTLLGALTLAAPKQRQYTEADLDLAQELGVRAALAIDNARLYRGAKEALRARDDFLSVAAHELRGPTTSIHLAVQGLRKAIVPGAAIPRVLDIIEREDRRLARLIDELHDLTRIRTNRIHFVYEKVDLAEVARAVVSNLQPELARSGSSLSITSEGLAVGDWDRTRLDQVVTNLLSNAIKFGLGQPIEIAVAARDGRATLAVTDHGIGIAPEMHDRIFEPFERVVSARNYGGLGLGLYIVRTLVEGLGGTVNVTSLAAGGTSFTIELPLARAT